MIVAAAAHFHLRGYIPPAASTALLPSNSKPLHISAFKAKEEEGEEVTSYINVDRGLRRRKQKNKKKAGKKKNKKKNRNKSGKKRNRNGNKKVKKNKKKGKNKKSSKSSKSKNGKR